MTLLEINEILKGGSGSGDFGHTGRAGKHGGSGGGGGKGKPRKGRRSREALDKEIEAGKKKGKKLDKTKIRSALPIIPSNATNFRFDKNDLVFDIGNRSHTMSGVRSLVEGVSVKPEKSSKKKKPVLKKSRITNDVKNRNNDKNARKLNADIDKHEASFDTPNSNTVDRLVRSTGVDKSTVESYINNWNGNDIKARYLVSESVQRTLGIGVSPYEKANQNKLTGKADNTVNLKSDYDKLTRAIYDETQKRLKELGSSEVLLYRGLSTGTDTGTSKGDITKWHGNTIDSWTTGRGVAEGFVGFADNEILMKSSMPISRIFSMSSSGPGTSSELEMIVLGNGPNDNVFIAGTSDDF